MLVEGLDERVRVVRKKRIPARVRAKRRRQYRKARGKRKRMGRKYRRTGRFRRLQRIRKRLKKRIARLRKGGRRRVYVASADPEDERLARLAENLADDEPDAEEPGPIDAGEVEDEVEEMERDPELAVAGMAHAYGLVASLADSHIQTLQALMPHLPPEGQAAAEDAIEGLEDAKNDAEAFLDVVGDPEEDEDENGDDAEGDGDRDEPSEARA